MEIMAYGGWDRCARFVAGELELIVTLEVGPRIIQFGRIGGPNELVEYAKDMGSTGGSEYRSYGGHRLWVAPEDPILTYEPDNDPVATDETPGGVIFTKRAGALGIERAIWVRIEEGRVLLEHRVTNFSESPRTIAPWCLTVMAPGGVCLFPQPEFRQHSEALLPAAPLVLWHYTRMADPRWTWGSRVVRLAQDPAQGPQKVGAAVRAGYAAYSNHGNLFIKRFPYLPGADYPDYGCNFETFTRQDMLEVESLGPLVTLGGGESVMHPETWYLVPGVSVPSDDEACGDWLHGLASERPPHWPEG